MEGVLVYDGDTATTGWTGEGSQPVATRGEARNDGLITTLAQPSFSDESNVKVMFKYVVTNQFSFVTN